MLPVLALAVALRAIGAIDLSLWQSIGLLLATLAAAGLALHGRLAADRPSPVYLTSYSLHVALGGALGGVLTGIVAPLVFRVPVEGLLVIAAAVVMVAGGGWLRLASIPPLVAVLVAVAWSLIGSPDTIRADRSFYGVYRVDEPRPGLHVLVSGTTIHGRETFDGPLAGEPLSYYHRAGPLGEVIESMQAELPAMRFGAVGLGAGAIAAYGRPADTYRIRGDRPDRGRDRARPGELHVPRGLGGDDRCRRRRRPARPRDRGAGSFDLLVLDAFSSDTVPVHLLTVESFATSMRTLAPRGVIAVHISNRFIDLEPVVAAAARDLGFVAIIGSDLPPPELSDLADASQWVVVGRSFADLAGLVEGDRWRTAHADGRRAWTDRYSDLLGALRD